MSINLPQGLIDEDQLTEAGVHLRAYADHAEVAHGLQIVGLGEHYEGQSYAALVGTWSNQSKGNMETLTQECHLLVGGTGLAADAVVGVKTKVIVQFAFAAGEFAAAQAAAVATLGLAEEAAAALIAAQNRILNECIAGVVAQLVAETLNPVSEQIDQAVKKLLYDDIVEYAGPSNPLKVDPLVLHEHAARMIARAKESQRAGLDLSRKLDRLQFLTGG